MKVISSVPFPLFTLLLAATVTLSAQDGPRIVGEADFDNVGMTYGYSYTYGGYSTNGVEVIIPGGDMPNHFALDSIYGKDGSFCLEVDGDFTVVPAAGSLVDGRAVEWNYAGLGGGGGLGNLVASNLVSVDLRDYTFTFWLAQTDGVLPGVLRVTGETELKFEVPDDTVQPPDGDTDADVILTLRTPFTTDTNYTETVLTLDEYNVVASAGLGSLALFEQYRDQVNNINVNWQLTQIPNEYGLDAENYWGVDDVTLVYEKAPPPPAVTEVVIASRDFEVPGIPYEYSYPYGGFDPGSGGVDVGGQIGGAHSIEAGMGTEGSSALVYRDGDFSVIVKVPPAVSNYGGFGLGGGVPFDRTELSSGLLEDYRLYVDVAALGLKDGVSSAGATVELKFEAPDDFFQPPDADTASDVLFTLTASIQPSEALRTFRTDLDKMTVTVGSLAALREFLDDLSNINVNVNMDNVPNDFDCDEDNAGVMDSVRFVRVIEGQVPPVAVGLNPAGQVVVSWEGSAQLQRASDLDLTFENVDTQGSNSYVVDPAGERAFYRLTTPQGQ